MVFIFWWELLKSCVSRLRDCLVEVVFVGIWIWGVWVVDGEVLFLDCVFEVDWCVIEVGYVYLVDDYFDVVEIGGGVVVE